MNNQTIPNFMDRFKKKRGFTLPPLYPHFVTKQIAINVVDVVIHNNRVDIPTVSTTVKNSLPLLDWLQNIVFQKRFRFILCGKGSSMP